jgi:dethiobiotin synthetase
MMLDPRIPRLFVAGTDTNVGKSVVSFLLLMAMVKRGLSPIYLKPIQTGCDFPNDHRADASVISKQLKNFSITSKCTTCCCLSQPKAPWFAALDANKSIDPDQLLRKINAVKKESHPLVVEGAGGLMVPINAGFLMLDLMTGLKLPVILVARDGLGTINHTLLSLAVLKAHGISAVKVVLMATSSRPTPRKMVAENRAAIEHFGHVSVIGHIGWIQDFRAIPDHIIRTIEKAFDTQ